MTSTSEKGPITINMIGEQYDTVIVTAYNVFLCKEGFSSLYEAINNISDDVPSAINVIGINKAK